jgi:hypothetical protein
MRCGIPVKSKDLLVVMQTTFRIRVSCTAALSVLSGFGFVLQAQRSATAMAFACGQVSPHRIARQE